MYAVRVVSSDTSQSDAELNEKASRLAEELIKERAAEAASGNECFTDEIGFSAGNPRVEHFTGVVHLYRRVPGKDEADRQLSAHSPEELGDRLCVLALPPDMGVADFCGFVGGHLPAVREMRLVRREGGAAATLVLLRMESPARADAFYKDFNAKPFSSLEPDVLCRLVFVKDVEMTSSTDPSAAAAAPAGQTELPTCPVCLERLDEHISGVVTTVCNHRFHNECLQRWHDASCPVCRYCAQASATTSHCSQCGTSQDLWICLICGHVGCGRYRAAHAADHWRSAGHAFALELEAQRVWDYARDGYVHRLVQSKTDGKLVEVPSPAPSSSHPPDAAPGGREEVEPAMEEALVASKLDHLAREYSHLLVSQLDAQRAFYEASLHRQASEAEAALSNARGDADASVASAVAARAEAREADAARRVAMRKLADVTGRLGKAESERAFLQQVNDSLLRNQRDLQASVAALQVQLGAEKARMQDLNEQLRDLMINLEAERAIASSDGEMSEAQLLPSPPPAPPPTSKMRSAKKR